MVFFRKVPVILGIQPAVLVISQPNRYTRIGKKSAALPIPSPPASRRRLLPRPVPPGAAASYHVPPHPEPPPATHCPAPPMPPATPCPAPPRAAAACADFHRRQQSKPYEDGCGGGSQNLHEVSPLTLPRSDFSPIFESLCPGKILELTKRISLSRKGGIRIGWKARAGAGRAWWRVSFYLSWPLDRIIYVLCVSTYDELFPNRRNESRPWDPADERPPAASPCRMRGGGQHRRAACRPCWEHRRAACRHPSRAHSPRRRRLPSPLDGSRLSLPGCKRRQRVGGKCIAASSETGA